MKHCETCKYRINSEDMDIDGYCTHRKITDPLFLEQDKKENDMLVSDGFLENGGGFWVGPKFGCVHHEEKE